MVNIIFRYNKNSIKRFLEVIILFWGMELTDQTSSPYHMLVLEITGPNIHFCNIKIHTLNCHLSLSCEPPLYCVPFPRKRLGLFFKWDVSFQALELLSASELEHPPHPSSADGFCLSQVDYWIRARCGTWTYSRNAHVL